MGQLTLVSQTPSFRCRLVQACCCAECEQEVRERGASSERRERRLGKLRQRRKRVEGERAVRESCRGCCESGLVKKVL